MQKQNNVREIGVDNTTQLISMSALLAPVLHARLLILGVTLFTMACGLTWALLFETYKSEGFFQFGGPIPIVVNKNKENTEEAGKGKESKESEKDDKRDSGITLSDFKRYAAAYSTSERFNEYVQDKKLFSVPGIDSVRRKFASRGGISRVILPVYPFTKLDAKELMEQPKGSSNNVIGLRIEYEGSAPAIAQQMVGILGQYAMDSIVYLTYLDTLRFKNEEIKTKITELDSSIIRNKMKLAEYQRRAGELRQIIARNPVLAGQGTRQVVEIKEDTARFLPPATLLTTTEVQIAEANEAILKAKYGQFQNQLLLEYYDHVKAMLDNTKSGETLLRSLEPLKESVFKNKNMQDDAVKEVYNMITVDNQMANNLYLNKSRFIAGPTLPVHSTVSLGLVLVVSLIIGFALSLLLIFGRHWLHNNRALFLH